MSVYFKGDAALKFQHQYLVTRDYIIPFIEKIRPLEEEMQILEMGCGEGGVLKAFVERNCHCLGVDLAENKLAQGRLLLKEAMEDGHLQLVNNNIFDPAFAEGLFHRFDFIILKDTIEHLPNKKEVLNQLKTFLAKDGAIFIAFPPWRMPFGGHQQNAMSKWAKLPFLHLLPKKIYLRWMRWLGEDDLVVNDLADIYDTRLSIGTFERLLQNEGYAVLRKRYYAINPIYRYKFNWTPREQSTYLSRIPYFRDFFTTAVYYLVKPH